MAALPVNSLGLADGVAVRVAATWDGCSLPASEVVDFSVRLLDGELTVAVTAPFYNDPPPSGPQGEKAGLWEYEVVELFLVGVDGTYLEVELGPHGHYLTLLLGAVREIKEQLKPLHYEARVSEGRWQGTIRLESCQLPLPFSHINAFAIHGKGDRRRYLAAFPLPGEKPDFHQPDFFHPLSP